MNTSMFMIRSDEEKLLSQLTSPEQKYKKKLRYFKLNILRDASTCDLYLIDGDSLIALTLVKYYMPYYSYFI